MSHHHDILLPDIGAGPHPVRVVQWLVDRGSDVLAGDRILEVAATGVLFVVSAPCDGVVVSQFVGIDAVVLPGDRLGVIAPDDRE